MTPTPIVDIYTATIDTCILLLLLVWSYMDRNNIYFREKDKDKDDK
jgi:hypothetical protein